METYASAFGASTNEENAQTSLFMTWVICKMCCNRDTDYTYFIAIARSIVVVPSSSYKWWLIPGYYCCS